MTDDQHGEGTPQRSSGRWDPLPQGDYDDGATAFVKLPEGGIEALLAERESPLAAPGHSYVPPQIAVAPPAAEPGVAGTWNVPAEAVQWPDPNAGHQDATHHDATHHDTGYLDTGHQQAGLHQAARRQTAHDGFSYHPGATGQWDFGEAAREGASTGHHETGETGVSGHDVTGQWSIPVAGGDLPDESGEFTTSALVEQWGGTPPATLPGGAAAPWATTETIGQPWSAAPRTVDPQAPEAPHAPAEPARASRADSPAEAVQAPAQAAHEAPEPVAGPAPATVGASGTPDAPEPDPAPAPTAASPSAPEAPEAPESDDRHGSDAPPADATEPEAPAEFPAPPHDEHPLASYVLRVNGADRPVTDAWIGESLLYVLRERLGLAGAKDGCSQGECGACNVQVDGRLVASCLVPGVTAASSEVRTVEGLAADGQPSDVQRALAKCGAVQCGFCIPGMAMTVHDLLEGNPAPTELETRQALCGNLCRCSGYRGVLDAVREVVAEREAHSAAAAEAAPDADEVRIPHQAGPGAGGVNPSAFGASGVSPGSPPSVYEDSAPYGAPSPYGAASPYGDPSPYDDPSAYDSQAPHEQPYGQDGGQA
ncbi:2Fe-2S iron-sulfur cluster-binding protein [Streptomyces sp. NBC_01136]|uniref:2Fe-2S iron-sulfur cluster-binding protein n=1 Tax=unclassified Streptomyces TaxID=2593676 RepID=UPI0032489C2E|nr:2Fe-2S iron-sulfur cluster-binding protein [Streptomyces sp. NBC_01136]